MIASVIAVGQRNSARHQAQVSLSRELATVSESLLPTNLNMALLLAVQAYDKPERSVAFGSDAGRHVESPARALHIDGGERLAVDGER